MTRGSETEGRPGVGMAVELSEVQREIEAVRIEFGGRSPAPGPEAEACLALDMLSERVVVLNAPLFDMASDLAGCTPDEHRRVATFWRERALAWVAWADGLVQHPDPLTRYGHDGLRKAIAFELEKLRKEMGSIASRMCIVALNGQAGGVLGLKVPCGVCPSCWARDTLAEIAKQAAEHD